MRKKNLLIVAVIGGVIVISAAYIANDLRGAHVESAGINMITAAAVDRAGATITETKQASNRLLKNSAAFAK